MLLIQPPKPSNTVGAPRSDTRLVGSWERGLAAQRFKNASYIRRLLKGDFMIIRLNDGRRMIVRKDSKGVRLNPTATQMLHELSEQKEAVVYGNAVVATLNEIGRPSDV
jgi:hypothetical protein